MQTTKVVLKRMVLDKLYDHLHDHYSFSRPKSQFVDKNLPQHDIDAAIAFKSDIRIEELRIALARIEDGNFGYCLHCGMEISMEDLRSDPTRRFCTTCEQILIGSSLDAT
jgi:RNA polymerase-binding transcription factor DksA